MFTMSKEELIARLRALSDSDFSALGDTCSKRSLVLLTPAGLITCSEVDLRSYEEVTEEITNTGTVNLLDMALSLKLPNGVKVGEQSETFLYCVNAELTPYQGGHISFSSICISLESVFGFSVGGPV